MRRKTYFNAIFSSKFMSKCFYASSVLKFKILPKFDFVLGRSWGGRSSRGTGGRRSWIKCFTKFIGNLPKWRKLESQSPKVESPKWRKSHRNRNKLLKISFSSNCIKFFKISREVEEEEEADEESEMDAEDDDESQEELKTNCKIKDTSNDNLG